MVAGPRQLTTHSTFTRQLGVAIGRIADIEINFGTVVEQAAGVRVGPKAPLAVVLAHPRVADAAERQVVNERVKQPASNRVACLPLRSGSSATKRFVLTVFIPVSLFIRPAIKFTI